MQSSAAAYVYTEYSFTAMCVRYTCMRARGRPGVYRLRQIIVISLTGRILLVRGTARAESGVVAPRPSALRT